MIVFKYLFFADFFGVAFFFLIKYAFRSYNSKFLIFYLLSLYEFFSITMTEIVFLHAELIDIIYYFNQLLKMTLSDRFEFE